ncbi:DNA alkylation repair protein [Candidatus Beckwithbacteria bacterium CG23_combo_of_CG06-09_8_20_14_all_34_8]|uniref:DNA alkylation repair protein n=1 Tax=Candidatus Beckwithbacteria bacterium CG23_combo_of_CG06-09_8_20_14_all_34_8 TaxID=1974497 RepID=A0A2H0B6D7_9BACT|nr:MAG: DNA alkylation repair protein [Candidatus Beckwithbacteria bacterium CG23_combo_of_CG06-09_8_20_14_all_34_8]
MNVYSKIEKDLKSLKNPLKIKIFKRFFKTGPGEYGEGDQFLGLTMPQQRLIAQKFYKQVKLDDLDKLIKSPIHEYRMTGLLILTYQYCEANDENKKNIYQYYLNNKDRINNWDLIDVTCPKIVGEYLWFHQRDLKVIDRLIKSENLWDRRIAVMATYSFIRRGQFYPFLNFAKILLTDKRDLINKVVGWMLREIGKKDLKALLNFLDINYQQMPRTMLRYSLEKLNPTQKDFYMGRTKARR